MSSPETSRGTVPPRLAVVNARWRFVAALRWRPKGLNFGPAEGTRKGDFSPTWDVRRQSGSALQMKIHSHWPSVRSQCIVAGAFEVKKGDSRNEQLRQSKLAGRANRWSAWSLHIRISTGTAFFD